MKKITLLIVAVFSAILLNAQFTYTTIKSDGFETTDGVPATFTRTGQAAWTGAVSPYTGGFWDLIFASALPKDYTVSAFQSDYHSGSQCIKIVTGTSTVPLRFRTVTGSPFTNGILDWGKFKVTVWAKGAAGSQIFDKNTFLATGNWDKYVFTANYSTGLTETRLMLDLKATAGTSATIYIDDILVEQYTGSIPTTVAATAINDLSFTASWNQLAIATGYRLTVSTSADAGTTWTAVAGSPFTIAGATTTSQVITGLTAATLYKYKVEGFDGTFYSPSSNETQLTTLSASGLLNPMDVFRVRQTGNNIEITSEAGLKAMLYNQLGQLIGTHTTTATTLIPVSQKGILIINIDGYTQKLLVK